jgi:hypothetical protein
VTAREAILRTARTVHELTKDQRADDRAVRQFAGRGSNTALQSERRIATKCDNLETLNTVTTAFLRLAITQRNQGLLVLQDAILLASFLVGSDDPFSPSSSEL